MALGWLTVLKTVPWGEVIGNAPKIADGARKLWSAVARKEAEAPAAGAGPAPASGPDAVAALEARLARAEADAAELRGQMVASSALIQALAEQNAQLVQRVEALRVRLAWLAGAAGVLGVAVAAAAAWMLLRG